MSETAILIAIGVAILVLPSIPWAKLLGAAKSIDIVPSADDSLAGAIKTLRYYLAMQDKATRERGFEACDTLDGIVSKQPLLANGGTDEQ